MGSHISIVREQSSGLLRVRGVGMWQRESARRHFSEVEEVIGAMRPGGGPVLVLMDLRQAPVQSSATDSVMADGFSMLCREADKIAVICETAMLALQMKRSWAAPNFNSFHEPYPAQAWLLSPGNDEESKAGW